MELTRLIWMFSTAIVLHNAEEAIWLPAWMQRNVPRLAVDSRRFRQATTALSLLACGLSWMAWKSGPRSFWTEMLTGAALVALVNIFVPHILLSLLTRRWMPGTVTGVVICLPALSILLVSAWSKHAVALFPSLACAAGLAVTLFPALGRLLRPKCGA